MKSSSKILSILAASSLVASIPVVLAQGAPPPPAPPPAPAPMAPAASGRGGNGGQGFQGGGQGFQAPDAPTTEELATINKTLRDLISKADPDAAKILAAHPTWMPITPFGGGNRGGRNGAGAGNFGGGTGGGGGRGGRGQGSGAPAGSGA